MDKKKYVYSLSVSPVKSAKIERSTKLDWDTSESGVRGKVKKSEY